MNAASVARLLVVAAIGGGSFFLMRIGVPALGPFALADFRLLVAAVFLSVLGLLWRRPLQWRTNARHYAALGFFSFALPLLLFAYAAQSVPASLMAILNATSPMFGAVLGAVRARQALAPARVAGLLTGTAGVAVLVGFDGAVLHPAGLLAVLGAALSYGVATVHAASARHLDPVVSACCSTWVGAGLLAPAVLLDPGPLVSAPALPAAALGQIALVVLVLGVFCTGVAFQLYFRLVTEVGPTSALTVTYLVPLFGVLWGRVFLDEPLHWQTVLGGVIVVVGTALTMGGGVSGMRSLLARVRPA